MTLRVQKTKVTLDNAGRATCWDWEVFRETDNKFSSATFVTQPEAANAMLNHLTGSVALHFTHRR